MMPVKALIYQMHRNIIKGNVMSPMEAAYGYADRMKFDAKVSISCKLSSNIIPTRHAQTRTSSWSGLIESLQGARYQ